MVSIERRVGRLLEIRFAPPLTREEVDAFAAKARSRSDETSARMVSCVDMRSLRLLPPDVSEAFVEVLRGTNPRIERTACLLPEDAATLMLQIERMHREAGNPARRTFRSRGELERWLGEVLGASERSRLGAFLDGA